MKIAVVGNCQAIEISRILRVLLPECSVGLYAQTNLAIAEKREELSNRLDEADIIFSQPVFTQEYGAFSKSSLSLRKNNISFPAFSFLGFHPDCVYIGTRNSSPVGDYNSSIAVYSFLLGLTPKETLKMYNEDVYEALGFFDIWDISISNLIQTFKNFDLNVSSYVESWIKRGLFMHTINHPYTSVCIDLACCLLTKAGLTSFRSSAAKFVSDHGADDIVWPVYPEIGQRLGLEGELTFKVSDRFAPADRRPFVMDLDEFISGSFERYRTLSPDVLSCRGTVKSHNQSMEIMGDIVRSLRRRSQPRETPAGSRHPYKGLPDFQFWRKAVTNTPIEDIDLVVSSQIKILSNEKVATGGSCFAQHIASRLSQAGFLYFVTETPATGVSEEEAKARNYGVFSARYGNIYTARQLLQLFDRAMGAFDPRDSVWQHPRGGYVDPFRPQIEPEGLPSEQAVLDERERHFEAVRKLFKEADVFIFTLGLTECSYSKIDGAVFPLAPGVAGGRFNDDEYGFINFTAAEVADDLIAFVEKLRQYNPACRVLLTVSPVPLIATFEPRHVVLSTIYSKSALRVAAEQVCKTLDQVFYFPSFEIIAGHHTKGIYFDDDMRSVRREGIDHVMKLFFKHLTDYTPSAGEAAEHFRPSEGSKKASNGDILARLRQVDEVVCDEEALEPD